MDGTQIVKSFSVTADKKQRTVQIDIKLESEEKVSISWPLPMITRLTDRLIDAEFSERFPSFDDTPNSNSKPRPD